MGFAETTNPLGGAEFATRIASADRSQLTNGTTTQYESSIGFKVTCSQPTPAAYFYGLDIDGDEWKTAFGFDNAGNFVAPNILTEPGTSNLKILPNTPIDEAGWETDIPGLDVPSALDLIVVETNSSPVGPETTTNQVIYDFGGQALTELYFFYGLEALPQIRTQAIVDSLPSSSMYRPWRSQRPPQWGLFKLIIRSILPMNY